MGAGRPGRRRRSTRGPVGSSTEVVAAYADRAWITNSRNTADEEAVRTLASMAGFTPRIEHRIDSLELVASLIRGGLGVGLLAHEHARRGRASTSCRCSTRP